MNQNISTNTLFHFTSEKKSLISILKNGFFSRYSLENFESLLKEPSEIVFPMICFCDIPLSQIAKHSKTYGGYAIGLTKTWGMQKKINPIIYTYPNSYTASILNTIQTELDDYFQVTNEHLPCEYDRIKNSNNEREKKDFRYKANTADKFGKVKENLSHFLKYIKPYEGRFFRNGKYLDKNIKFYDEREWRYVPDKATLRDAKVKDSYIAEVYKNPIQRRAINIKIAKHAKLNFKPDDIRFIIVPKDNEIPKMLEELENIFGNIATMNEMKILGTRLISLEQIIEDI